MEYKIDETGNPILDQFSEEGFVDCVFRIENFEESEHHLDFSLYASYNSKLVGMKVKIFKFIQNGFDSEMSAIQENFYPNRVIFYRTGIESDRLIIVLAKLYGLEINNIKMVEKESFTAFALTKEPVNLKSEFTRLKLFGKDESADLENDYYESFFNLDIANGFVYWNEKDQDYRLPLINGMSSANV